MDIKEIRTFIATFFFSIVLIVNGLVNLLQNPNPYGLLGYLWFGWISLIMGAIIFISHLFRKK